MYLFNPKKPYLFHLHTNLTDGSIKIERYFQAVKQYKNISLGFLEHIRQTPTYDPIEFIETIRNYEKQYKIPVKIGFEINVSETCLNIPSEVVKTADMIGLASHRCLGTPIDLLNAYIATIKQLRGIKKDTPIVWVHPGLWFQKNDILQSNSVYFFTLLKYVIKKGLLIEINKRYNLPPAGFIKSIPRKQLIIGYDIHTYEDLVNSLKNFK